MVRPVTIGIAIMAWAITIAGGVYISPKEPNGPFLHRNRADPKACHSRREGHSCIDQRDDCLFAAEVGHCYAQPKRYPNHHAY